MSQMHINPQISLLRDMLYCTIGQDPNVFVGPLTNHECGIYEITIEVRGQSRAEAMRIIVPEEYLYGEEKVCVKIYCNREEIIWPCTPHKNGRDVANVFCRALSSNDFFIGVKLGPDKLLPICNEISVLMRNEWIYFYAPEYKECVAKVFSQVIKISYGILIITKVRFRTYDMGCENGAPFYCGGMV